MAEVEIRIPKDLGLSQEQRDRLQESFDKQLADTMQGGAADKADEIRVADTEDFVHLPPPSGATDKADESRAVVRAKAKSKTEVV